MFTVVGYCPKCGAPIYAPSVWNAITPPPSYKTCTCFPESTCITTTSTTYNGYIGGTTQTCRWCQHD
jgi:hypothetical protein